MNDATLKNTALTLAAKVKSAGITQTELSQALGASQSQISRLLSGRCCRRSALFDRLCIYVQNYGEAVPLEQVQANEELMSALADVWDGTPLQPLGRRRHAILTRFGGGSAQSCSCQVSRNM